MQQRDDPVDADTIPVMHENNCGQPASLCHEPASLCREPASLCYESENFFSGAPREARQSKGWQFPKVYIKYSKVL